MISKALLQKVLDKDINQLKITRNIVYYGTGLHKTRGINIYELANKCKEWAVKSKGFILSKLIMFDTYTQWQVVVKQENFEEQFTADTEPEAIFKACEYIMEQNDQK